MRTRTKLSAAAVVAAALVGVALATAREGSRRVEPPPLDPRLAKVLPLEPGSELLLETPRDHSPLPLSVRRRVVRWETVDGVPHARVEWSTGGDARWRQRSVDWLRVEALPDGGLRVVCTQRQLGPGLIALDPPQPVLELPLAAGRRWSWEGEVRGEEVRLEAEVRLAQDSLHGEVFEVVQRVQLDEGPPAVTVSVYAPGRGLVSERWTLAEGREVERTAKRPTGQ